MTAGRGLSVAAPRFPGMQFHPWRRFRELAHFELREHIGGDKGETDFEERTVSLRRGLSYEERRSTVAHECLHIDRGPVPGGLTEREELRVNVNAARLLLPDVALVADELAWADHDLNVAAWWLAVDVATLRTRLLHLHPSERHFLTRRLTEDDAWKSPREGANE